MDLMDLKVFEAVSTSGSMNRAAKSLHTVQSNVTMRIKKLEAELGVPLFKRGGKGVSLTASGARLLPYARQIQAMMREAERAARDDGLPRGELRIGSLETTAAFRLPDLLAAYVASCPKVALTVSTGTSRSLTQDVIEHRLDGAFVVGPVNHPELESATAFTEELVIVAPPRFVAIEELAAVDELRMIVFRSGCAYRLKFEDWLARQGRQLTVPLEFGSLEAVIGCVAAGIGATMLPRIVAERAALGAKIAIFDLADEEASAKTVFIFRRDAYPGGAMRAFRQLVDEERTRAASAFPQNRKDKPAPASSAAPRYALLRR